MDCLTSKRLFQQICSYKCQFCLEVWASSTAGPSGSYDGWEKCKEKVPVSDPNQNAETTCNFKLKLHNLKIYSSKGCRKTSQRWIICMYLANTAVLNIRIFSRRYHFRLQFLLRLVNAFTTDTDEYYPVCYKVNDAKAFKNLVPILFYAC